MGFGVAQGAVEMQFENIDQIRALFGHHHAEASRCNRNLSRRRHGCAERAGRAGDGVQPAKPIEPETGDIAVCSSVERVNEVVALGNARGHHAAGRNLGPQRQMRSVNCETRDFITACVGHQQESTIASQRHRTLRAKTGPVPMPPQAEGSATAKTKAHKSHP